MNDNIIIECENVTLAYGREVVLEDVDLKIPAGVFLPFVGPNGAGKTTLLRAILGLIKPRSGHIRTPFDHQTAGYVPQHKAIDPIYPVSVESIVRMGLYPEIGWWRRPDNDQKERLAEALEMFSLTEHAHKTFDKLSGGMKQKVMIARAFVGGSPVLVMDEPTSELDAGAEYKVLEHLHELTRTHSKTVLVAHHGMNHVESLADNVCLIEHGSVETVPAADLPQRGKWIEELFRKPNIGDGH